MTLKALAIAAAVFVAAQSPTVDEVRDRLDKYLLEYEPVLGALVAEEQLSQRDGPSFDAVRQSNVQTVNRELISEVAFIGLPGNAGWLGFRHVVKMNGKTQPGAGKPLGEILADGAKNEYEQARLLLAESAKLNLGMPRTTNLPNLPLEFLHPRNRRRFAHRDDGREKIRGLETMRMVLNETASPSIIQRPEGGDVPSTVTAWVESSSGRLIRAEVRSRDARIGVLPFEAVVWVDFKDEPALKLLVPAEMKEEFYAGRFRDGTGVAKYSKYRKFQTSGRIVPQP
jgi:hypothetical protein